MQSCGCHRSSQHARRTKIVIQCTTASKYYQICQEVHVPVHVHVCFRQKGKEKRKELSPAKKTKNKNKTKKQALLSRVIQDQWALSWVWQSFCSWMHNVVQHAMINAEHLLTLKVDITRDLRRSNREKLWNFFLKWTVPSQPVHVGASNLRNNLVPYYYKGELAVAAFFLAHFVFW